MSNFDVVTDVEGREHLMFDSSELYDDKNIGTKFDDYEIIKLLGKGAFGQVFKVRCKLNNKIYAMKRINADELKKENEKAYILSCNETSFLEGLKHSHIIKYYKNFTENGFLYIIIEYVANGDMNEYIKAQKMLKKHIQEEELWNIFLQCMSALSYVHSVGVIHRDIKPANLLIDNNMTIKLGDFGVSAIKNKDSNNQYLNANYNFFKNKENMQYHGTYVGTGPYMAKEILQNLDYDQKVDVYSMGVSFYEMCYFHLPKKYDPGDNEVHYSNELMNIIKSMLEDDKNKRKTSEEIYNLIKSEYSRKYVKNTSIEAVIRCLYSLNSLTNNFLNLPLNEIINKNITQSYISCLRAVNQSNIWTNLINNFRSILGQENPRLEGTKEVDPKFILAFLIKELHKELNKSQSLNDKNNNHLIISGEESSKTSKVEMMLVFVNDFFEKFNSILSNNLLGLIKKVYFCNNCKIKTYSFNSYFLVTFDLKKIFPNNNNQLLNLEESFANLNQTVKKTELYCSKCLNKNMHSCYKKTYSFPNLLIISIQRGISINYKNPVNIKENLDLSSIPEFEFCPKKFFLTGFLVRNLNGSYFSVIRSNQQWLKYEGANINQVNSPSNYNYNQDGDILMLFYHFAQ